MHHPNKKWLCIIGLVIIISLVLLCGTMLSKERSVSNLYIIPAGFFSPPSLSYPAPPPTIATLAGIGTTTTPPVNASSPVPAIGVPVTTANTPASEPKTRSSLNVLRGEPFTINGTVDNLSITKVQVWVLNSTISATIIPVMPDGTFQVTFDSRETDALSRTYTSAVLVQYPKVPGQFAVSWDTNRNEAIETKSGRTTPVLDHIKDPGMYPTTQVDYLEQGTRAAGDSAKIYFLNGVDGWITIDPMSPVKPGTLIVRGNTSL